MITSSSEENPSSSTKTPNTNSTPIPYFSEEQLQNTAIRDLYTDLCHSHGQTPCPGLLKQLPASPEDVDEVQSLDFSSCYFGRKGLATIFPVIDACHRVVHINLTGVGLEAGGGTLYNLLEILKNHRGIREVVLSKNRVGTETVLKLCHLAYSRGLLYKVDLDDAWVVDPLKKRLQKILDANSLNRDKFERPGRRFEQKPAFDLIADAPTPPPEVDPIDVPLVPQICRILAQLRQVIVRHQMKSNNKNKSSSGGKSISDLQAMFKPLVPGVCSATSFMRVVKLLNLDQVENEFSLHELSDVCGTTVFVEGGRVIKYGRILSALRDHCCVFYNNNNSNDNSASPALVPRKVSVEMRDLFDHIFDSRQSILESCEMIDIDATGHLCFDDFVAGIAASTQTSRVDTEMVLSVWYEAAVNGKQVEEDQEEKKQQEEKDVEEKKDSNVVLFSPSPKKAKLTSLSSIPYKVLLDSLELVPNELLPVTAEGWEQWTARLLREQM